MRRIKKKQTTGFYDLEPIRSLGCQYNIIIGERSNGKTYSVLKHALKVYWSTGGELAVIRRWDVDFQKGRAHGVFEALVNDEVVKNITDGEWTGVTYYNRHWFLNKRDKEGNLVKMDRPFAYAFALGGAEHDKSISFPRITTILFDEFLTRGQYLPDEFTLLMNTISTIVRYRDNVTIFMLGNTVNQYCPYIQEMGLTHIKDMEQGTIDVYQFGENKPESEQLKVAVEYCGSSSIAKPSNKYFAFDNPKLKMITSGVWEVAVYPHLQVKYRPKDILFTYFIKFTGDLLQCELIQVGNAVFTYIHRKTTPIKDEDNDLVYCPEVSYKPNWRRRISKSRDKIDKTLYSFFLNEKVFYQDNMVGEIVRNYLLWCGTSLIES